MATRYYPAVKAPNVIVHGPARGSWAKQSVFTRSWSPVQWTWRLAQTKVNAGTQSPRTISTNQQADFDLHFARWMTPPLEAQSLSGTLQICFGVQAVWDDPTLGFTNDAIVRFKVHAYLAVGQTTTVRTTLIDNYVDPVNFPGISGEVWRSLATAQSLAAATAIAGDVIVVELGFRVVQSPTPAPQYFPTDTGVTTITFRATGANSAFADATAGATSTSLAPWVEFSQTLTEQAAPAPPANDACTDAIVIGAFPYESAFIDTTASTDVERGAWWTFTAPTTGKMLFHTFGSNYGTIINGFTGGCAALAGVFFPVAETDLAQHRSQSSVMFDVTAGIQYWIRVRNSTASTIGANNAPEGGGLLKLVGRYVDRTPLIDDLYLPAGYVCALRDGVLINFNAGFFQSAPTGVAIDYTKRTMNDLNGGTHSADRLLVGLHAFELVEILDLATLDYGDFQSEIDFIGDPWTVPTVNIHPAQLYVNANGLLHAGWFGNGYLYIVGQGTLPAILNTVSNNPDYSALKIIDATSGDSQPGAPFADLLRYPAVEVTAPWAIAIDEASNTLYYTSGGFYEPVGGQLIKRFDLTGNTQLADFASIPPQAGNNPGLKGLRVLPGGGVLVCNSTVVHRLNSSGTIIQTYTPSIAEDSQSLCDVQLTADGTAFWVVDEPTTRLFKFAIATGVELLTIQPYLRPGTLVQMAIFQPSGAVTPPEPPASIIGCPPSNLAPASVTGLDGCASPL